MSRTPDWSIWRSAEKVRLRDAILLSMGIEPSHVSDLNDEELAEYQKRQTIAMGWLGDSLRGFGESSAKSTWLVDLKEFGDTASLRGWWLPEEFPRIPPSDSGNRKQKSELEWGVLEVCLNGGMGCDFDYWLKLKALEPQEVACLAHGVDPRFWKNPSRSQDAKFRGYGVHTSPDAIEQIEDTERELSRAMPGQHPPEVWARLMAGLGYDLPPRIAELVRDSSPIVMAKPLVEDAKESVKRTRTDALKEVMRVALSVLMEERGRIPTTAEMFEYITERDDSGTISEVRNTGVVWLTESGKEVSTSKVEVGRRLKKLVGDISH